MRSFLLLTTAGYFLAVSAGCTEVPVYPDPVVEPTPIASPPPPPSNYGGTTLPIAPLVPMLPEGQLQNPQGYNGGGLYQLTPPVSSPLRPNLSSDSPDYWTDPRLPSNRGQWQTVHGPNGQPLRVYSTDVDPHAPDAVHRVDLPAGSGFQPADTRWDPQRR